VAHAAAKTAVKNKAKSNDEKLTTAELFRRAIDITPPNYWQMTGDYQGQQYKAAYMAEKIKAIDTVPDMTLMWAHNRGMRRIAQLILRDLRRNWRAMM